MLRVVKKLNDFMRLNHNYDIFLKYFDDRLLNYFERIYYNLPWKVSKDDLDGFIDRLERRAGFDFSVRKFEIDVEKRKAVRFLKTTLTDQWDRFSKQHPAAASIWLRSDELTRWYLLNRACDLVYYGEPIANRIFPQPTFSGAEDLVASLVWLLKDTEARLIEAK